MSPNVKLMNIKEALSILIEQSSTYSDDIIDKELKIEIQKEREEAINILVSSLENNNLL